MSGNTSPQRPRDSFSKCLPTIEVSDQIAGVFSEKCQGFKSVVISNEKWFYHLISENLHLLINTDFTLKYLYN